METYSKSEEELWKEALKLSYEMAELSKDPSTQNGAVLMQGDQVLSTGYNHFPPGVSDEYWHGDKEAKYARVVHAEVSAILNAGQNGRSTIGSTLVCGWAACSNCAKHIAAAGVTRLVRHSYSNSGTSTGSHWYADCEIGDEIMRSAGIEIIELPPVPYGITLRRDGKDWTPRASV